MKTSSLFPAFFLLAGFWLFLPTEGWSQFTIQPIDFPSERGSGVQFFSDRKAGTYAIWLETCGDSKKEVRFAKWMDGAWSASKLIHSGDQQLHANWIDRLQLQFFRKSKKELAAAWLVRSDPRNSYSHHIEISISRDGGENWSPPFRPYVSEIPAYYGVLQMAAPDKDSILLVWQDGRNTVQQVAPGRFYPRMGQRVHLRSNSFSRSGAIGSAQILADSISQLSPIDLVAGKKSATLSYLSDNARKEKTVQIRTFRKGNWEAPTALPTSTWAPNFAPMNGPQVAQRKKKIAIAWYQKRDSIGQISLSIQKRGKEKMAPRVILEHKDLAGRFDLCWLNRRELALVWVEGSQEEYQIRVARIDAQGQVSDQTTVEAINMRLPTIRPQLSLVGDQLLLSYGLRGEQGATRIRSFLLGED